MQPETVSMQEPTDLPKYQRLKQELASQIENGLLGAGEKLPSLRAVCKERGVSLITAQHTYRLLEKEGLIVCRPQSGFYVAARLPIDEPRQAQSGSLRPAPVKGIELINQVCRQSFRGEVLPLGTAVPGESLLPLKSLSRIAKRTLAHRPEVFSKYADPFGLAALRRELAKRYARIGLPVPTHDIVIQAGAVDAVHTALRAVTKPGSVIITERPSYFIMLQAAAALDLKILGVPHDPGSGINLKILETQLKKHRIAAVLITANFQNPGGTLMSDASKEKLVHLCAKHEVPIIEDDVFAETSHQGSTVLPLKYFDQKGLVIHCSSVSKVLGPGLRVGWSIPGQFRDRIEHLKLLSQVAVPLLPQHIVAEYMDSLAYDRQRKTIGAAFGKQCTRYRHALAQCFPPATRISNPTGSFVLWIELPKGYNASTLYEDAQTDGIGIAPGVMFGLTRDAKRFMRISCGEPWSEKIAWGIERLGLHLERQAS